MKTINILPSINNIALSGRIVNDPAINEAKTSCSFRLIHNFGGDKEPVTINVVMFDKKGEGNFPKFIKKGAAVMVNAVMKSNNYTNAEGEKVFGTSFIVKKIEEVASANDIQFAGRLVADAKITGKRCTFTVIRNFGGDKEPLSINFVMFDKDEKFQVNLLKKGTPVVVKAYLSSNNFTNDKGEKIYRTEYVVKSIEKAELVAKEVEDKVTEAEAETAEGAE